MTARPKLVQRTLMIGVSALSLLSAAGCALDAEPPRNFEECLARGNPAMLSYPQRCHDPDSGTTFTEAAEPADTLPNTGSID
jgi:hypothetical protein